MYNTLWIAQANAPPLSSAFLKEWGEIWEDFCDVLVSESCKDEPTVAWEMENLLER